MHMFTFTCMFVRCERGPLSHITHSSQSLKLLSGSFSRLLIRSFHMIGELVWYINNLRSSIDLCGGAGMLVFPIMPSAGVRVC